MDGVAEPASGTTTPHNPNIEVRPSSTRGLGVFAKTKIPAGTRIICEPPLLVIPDDHYLKSDVEAALAKLDPRDQERFMALASAHGQPAELWPKAIHPSVRGRERQRIEEQHEARTGAAKTALSVFMTNAMSWGERSEGAAAFATASRFNHACTPNAHFAWNHALGAETVHVVRDVAAGDEVLLSYCDPLFETALRRWVFMGYGFECDCPACGEAGFEGQAEAAAGAGWQENFAALSGQRRYRLREISEALGDMRFRSPVTPVTPVDKGSGRELTMLLEGAGLMVEEGLVSPGLAQFYLDIAQNCKAKGDLRFALGAAEKGYGLMVTCLGADAPRAIEAESFLADLRAASKAKGE